MQVSASFRDDEAIRDFCAALLYRDYAVAPRHGAGRPTDGFSAYVADAWRFPWVDAYRDPASFVTAADPEHNDVTFIWFDPQTPAPTTVEVFGSFAPLHQAFALRRIGDSRLFAVTLRMPMGAVHSYRFRVDGAIRLDPTNPQRATGDNGVAWSRFFTWGCSTILELDPLEVLILDRLTSHILPLNGPAARRFLETRYNYLEREVRKRQLPRVGRLDPTLGAVSYIDKVLAGAERQHRLDYRICLAEIRRLLELRYPDLELRALPKDAWVEVYEQMGSGPDGDVPGWRYERYGRPRYFLELLRRHTWTGAFSHPRYGGNVNGTGWAWLAERYRTSDGSTLFDWQRHQPPPLGRSDEYHG